ncbi:protein KTI12 homolog isoform X2 [Tribolium castaneum]|uniref:protein KTI12 homolog isoform X2 n=1 Tax=Tribolium castaneum TaxID=7070 RepID=UPI00046C0248|nr:PREDICTED: protein KTI12 homolog isoform X2 [Tribolium castaneum]|eukprot:XP_008196615.1 PREDICTED: protein KTI12 homolog isoform X2 [Tribolium castaneum]
MPLIVVTGVPCSGKTTRSTELKQFFESHGKEVHVVSEFDQIIKANFEKNAFFSGYRYELYCGSKANKNTQCTVHTEINRDEAWKFNEKRPELERYIRDTFDALLMRYEDPDGKNRWDSPLFVVFPGQELDKSAIMSCLFDSEPVVPNMSTQNPPLNSTNLYDLDQVTKKITDGLVKSKNMGVQGAVKIEDFPHLSIDISNVTVQKLMILRRQYLSYCKLHPPDTKQIPQLFIQYLITSLQ